jgi:hypothetical protein
MILMCGLGYWIHLCKRTHYIVDTRFGHKTQEWFRATVYLLVGSTTLPDEGPNQFGFSLSDTSVKRLCAGLEHGQVLGGWESKNRSIS